MAFTVTARHAGQASQTQTVTTGSATPTGSSLLLVFSGDYHDDHFTAAEWQTPTGGSLTYTSIATSASFPWNGASNFSLSCAAWRAPVGGSPSSFAATTDAYSGTQTGYYNALTVDITGHDPTTPVVQSKTGGAQANGGDTVSGSITLDSTPAVGSLVVVHFSAGNDSAGAFTAPTIGGQPMTQHHNQTATFCHGGVWSRVITGAESNNIITCSDMGQTVGNWAGVAVEIAEATASGSVALDGAAPAASSATGTLAADRPLTGTGSVATAPTAALSTERALAGTAAGASAATGDVAITRAVAAVSAAAGHLGGDLSTARTLTGSASAASSAIGPLVATRLLSGTAPATSGADGTLTVARALTGSASAASGASGEMTATADALLDGSAPAAANATGELSTGRALTGAASGSASATGTMLLERPLTATSSAAAGMVGTLTVSRVLGGIFAASSSAAGELTAGDAAVTVTGPLTLTAVASVNSLSNLPERLILSAVPGPLTLED